MADPFPAEGALIAISEAEERFYVEQEMLAKGLLDTALAYKAEVESFKSPPHVARGRTYLTAAEVNNHRMFTDVLKRAFVLAWLLGDHDRAKRLYSQAIAWADDPNCSSQQQYEEIVRTWNKLNRSWVQKFFPRLMRRLVGVRKFFRGVYDYEPQKRT